MIIIKCNSQFKSHECYTIIPIVLWVKIYLKFMLNRRFVYPLIKVETIIIAIPLIGIVSLDTALQKQQKNPQTTSSQKAEKPEKAIYSKSF